MRYFSFILLCLLARLGSAQTLTPARALQQYLDASTTPEASCAGRSFAVQIDASVPKWKKRGSMSGVKLLSQTGHIVYRSLEFTGDKLVKTDVIARFLSQDAERHEHPGDTGLNRRNYSFTYLKTAEYNGVPAFVYHLKPLHKRAGLFAGELWLDSTTSAPLRLWGDFVKSPSFFIRSFRFVEDYQDGRQCLQPLRLLVTADTRIAGPVEMSEWLRLVALPVPADGDQSR